MTENTPQWVSSREGAELLGLKQPNFLYYAKTGDIAVKPGSKARERLYSYADILKVRQQLLAKAKAKRPIHEQPLLDWLSIGDVPAALKLDHLVYAEDIDLAEAAVYQSWKKSNPLLTMGAFSQDRSECLAYLQLVPLDERVILEILSGRRSESSITPDEVRSYDEPGGYTLLAVSAVCQPDRSELLYVILRRYMDFWKSQYPERFIAKIYAQAVSERGDMLIQHFFMAPRYDLSPNAYVLDLARPSASRIVRRFQEELKQIAPLPEGLQRSYSPVPSAAPAPAPAPVQPSQKPRANRQPRTEHPAVNDMPAGLIGWREFARRHGIGESTVQKAINEGHLQLTSGSWTVGRAPVKGAFNAEQQQACIARYADNPRFHQCDDQGCPCHHYTT